MGYWEFNEELAKQYNNSFSEAQGDVNKYIGAPKFNSEFYKTNGMDLITCLDNFFNSEHISKLVEDNKWTEVFDCWVSDYANVERGYRNKFYGNKPGWPLCRLVHFLVLSGVDFGNYLNNHQISYNLSKGDIEYCGFHWVDDDEENK